MGEEPLKLSPEDREWLKAHWHYTFVTAEFISQDIRSVLDKKVLLC